jgi:hypothetical protein
MLQGWILIAKQRAIRDGAPRGIRLVPPVGPPEAQYVTQLQYIEQPTAYRPEALDSAGNPVPAALTIQADFKSVLIQFPNTVTDPNAALVLALNALWPNTALPPDVVFEFQGRYPGQPRRVLRIDQQSTPPGLLVTLDQKLEPDPLPPPPTTPSTEYRFYRSAQPLAGEPALEMPRDVAIDISRDPNSAFSPTWHRTFPAFNPGGGQPFDVLFDQSGKVIGPTGRMSARICLWVRDVSLLDPCPGNQLPPGENSLITIYTRTGLIAAHPIDPSGLTPGSATWNPFRFTQDARSSGL